MCIISFTALRTLLQEEGLKSVLDILLIVPMPYLFTTKPKHSFFFEDKLKWIGPQKHHTAQKMNWQGCILQGHFFRFVLAT